MSDLGQTVDLLNVLGDSTRVRLMNLLDGGELSVAELTRITDLPQSRVSTHLGKLRTSALVQNRRVGGSTYYGMDASTMNDAAREVWRVVRARLDDEQLEQDQRRRVAVMSAREVKQPWPDEVAGQMERHYSPGRTWEATARGLLGFVRLGRVLDVGSGDGVDAALLAARCEHLTCLDRSARVLDAARERLGDAAHVDFVRADMHQMPFGEPSFDQVLMFNVLTYAAVPERALAEAARVLRPGGMLAVVTLAEHDHEAVAAGYDHVNLGFSPDFLRDAIARVGLRVDLCEISSRERKKPYFRVISAFAHKQDEPS